MPLPPALLLTLSATGDHLCSSMMPVIMRIRLSVPPPGAKGTTTSMFLAGYLACAKAAPGRAAHRTMAAADVSRERSIFILNSFR